MKHGELIDRHGGRWCETHKTAHGAAYPCDSYDLALQHEILVLGWDLLDSMKRSLSPNQNQTIITGITAP